MACWPQRATSSSPPSARQHRWRSTHDPARTLWHFQTGGNLAASPISYAVDGRQYLAIAAGNVVYAFALPE